MRAQYLNVSGPMRDLPSGISYSSDPDPGAVPLITAVSAVLVAVTDPAGGQTEPVTTAEVAGLLLSQV